MSEHSVTESGDEDRRYKAPALEKRLDILEPLATASAPMTLTAIVNQLGRSHGELFRMPASWFCTRAGKWSWSRAWNRASKSVSRCRPVTDGCCCIRNPVPCSMHSSPTTSESVGRSSYPAADPEDLERFRQRADRIRQSKIETSPTRFVAGVTDISVPVMRGGVAAALTVPFLETFTPLASQQQASEHLKAAAERIALELVEGDSRI